MSRHNGTETLLWVLSTDSSLSIHNRFQTYRDNSGLKHTMHRFDINQYFGGDGIWWDVSIDIETKDGTYWYDVDNRFDSYDDWKFLIYSLTQSSWGA